MANCAKMGLSLRDARSMSWWEYTALVWGHQPEEEQEAEAPDARFVDSRRTHLAGSGLFKVIH